MSRVRKHPYGPEPTYGNLQLFEDRGSQALAADTVVAFRRIENDVGLDLGQAPDPDGNGILEGHLDINNLVTPARQRLVDGGDGFGSIELGLLDGLIGLSIEYKCDLHVFSIGIICELINSYFLL